MSLKSGMLKKVFIAACLLLVFNSVQCQDAIDLSGMWQFRLDPEKQGHLEQWYMNKEFKDSVTLPGTTDTNKKGYETLPWPADSITRKFEFPRDFEHPDWIYEINTAPSRKYKYIGKAWYQREIKIPSDWDGKQLELFLERSLFKMELWIDGKKVGEDVALYTPRRFDITQFVKAGKCHRMTLCIDNTNLIGGMAHGYTYHTQTNWNGIVGKMEIRKHDKVRIESCEIHTNIYEKILRVETSMDNNYGKETEASFLMTILDGDGKVVESKRFERRLSKGLKKQEFFLKIDEPIVLWDEFTPKLYTLQLDVRSKNNSFKDVLSERFGFRKISTSGSAILVNDRPCFLRGTIDCAIYPKTGYMPMDRKSWQKILGTVKAYGMNHLRYHSVCPPKVAFEVADELGIYLQAELIWGPEPKPDTYVLEYLYNDGIRMLKEYGNHPSYAFMTLGNELWTGDNPFKNRVVEAYRSYDSRRIYSTQTGHVNKMHSSSEIRYNKTWENGESCNIPREELILNNDFDFSAGKSQNEPPLVIHENGQWVMYPGFDFMKKYDGVKRPDNFYPMYDKLIKNGLKDQDQEMAIASGKHGVWHIKQVFESLYRTEGVGGFQFLSLSDFPGQSEAMIGILDPFWDSKGYISEADFKQFCNEVVPLLRFKKWVYKTSETFSAKASVFNYGPRDLSDKLVRWTILGENGKLVKRGSFEKASLIPGMNTNVGNIEVELDDFRYTGKYVIELRIEGTEYINKWDFYVYPEPRIDETSGDIYVTKTIDSKAKDMLTNGGKVLLLWPTKDYGKNVQPISFTPHYWSYNRGALGRKYPGTAGMLCDPSHPLFTDFPSQSYADARWMNLIDGANAFVLNDFKEIKPIVQMIDDYHRNNKLGAVFEARIGKGKLLACALDIESNLVDRPVACHLKQSIMNYMKSSKFNPSFEFSLVELSTLLPDPKTINRVVEGTSRWPLHDYRDMLDGDIHTFWSSEWNGEWRASASHHVIIELGTQQKLSGCIYTPRQDSENGRVGRYEIFVSLDGENWGNQVATGKFENTKKPQKVLFNDFHQAKFIKFVSVSEVNNRKWAAIAELEFF